MFFVTVKFIYSEKASKFYEIFTLLLTVYTVVKRKVKISQNFETFSEYMNFKILATIWMKSDFNGNYVKADKSFANLKEERGFRFESYTLSTFLYFLALAIMNLSCKTCYS